MRKSKDSEPSKSVFRTDASTLLNIEGEKSSILLALFSCPSTAVRAVRHTTIMPPSKPSSSLCSQIKGSAFRKR